MINDLLSRGVVVHFGYRPKRRSEFVHGRSGRCGGLTGQRTFWKIRKIKNELKQILIKG